MRELERQSQSHHYHFPRMKSEKRKLFEQTNELKTQTDLLVAPRLNFEFRYYRPMKEQIVK